RSPHSSTRATCCGWIHARASTWSGRSRGGPRGPGPGPGPRPRSHPPEFAVPHGLRIHYPRLLYRDYRLPQECAPMTGARPMRRPFPGRAATLVLGLAVFASASAAQEPYRQPPQVIMDILDAAPLPGVSVSPDREWLLLQDRSSMPTIADMAEPILRIAGTRINPARNL